MPQWWSDIHFPLKPGRLKYGSWVWIPPAAPYRERGVMVTHLLWEQELQFKSDVFDQLVFQHAFHKIPSHYSQLSGNGAVWHSKLGKWCVVAKRLRQGPLKSRFREFESLRRNLYATVVELTYTSILGVDAERLASLSLACGTTVIEWLRTVCWTPLTTIIPSSLARVQ